MSIWSKIGKIGLAAAPYVAAPFTGGASLMATGAANKALSKWNEHDAQKNAEKGIGPSKFDRVLGAGSNIAGMASGMKGFNNIPGMGGSGGGRVGGMFKGLFGGGGDAPGVMMDGPNSGGMGGQNQGGNIDWGKIFGNTGVAGNANEVANARRNRGYDPGNTGITGGMPRNQGGMYGGMNGGMGGMGGSIYAGRQDAMRSQPWRSGYPIMGGNPPAETGKVPPMFPQYDPSNGMNGQGTQNGGMFTPRQYAPDDYSQPAVESRSPGSTGIFGGKTSTLDLSKFDPSQMAHTMEWPRRGGGMGGMFSGMM